MKNMKHKIIEVLKLVSHKANISDMDAENADAIIAELTEGLTEDQQKVYDKIVEGLSNKEIGQAIGITEKTVKFHISGIHKKKLCKTRSQLIVNHYKEKLGVLREPGGI